MIHPLFPLDFDPFQSLLPMDKKILSYILHTSHRVTLAYSRHRFDSPVNYPQLPSTNHSYNTRVLCLGPICSVSVLFLHHNGRAGLLAWLWLIRNTKLRLGLCFFWAAYWGFYCALERKRERYALWMEWFRYALALPDDRLQRQIFDAWIDGEESQKGWMNRQRLIDRYRCWFVAMGLEAYFT